MLKAVSIHLPVKRETDMCSVVIQSRQSEDLSQSVTVMSIKFEQGAQENVFTGYSGLSCSRTGDSQIVDVRHEVGVEEPVCFKSEPKHERSLDEDAVLVESSDIPWQVYKNGELIRHIWVADSRKLSSMGTSDVNSDVDSCSAMEQPKELQTNLERTMFEQTMGTNYVDPGINSRSTIQQAVKPVAIVYARRPEPGQLLYCELCESNFKDHHLMDRHMRNHLREKHRRCSVCDYTCTCKNPLIRHTRTQTGVKPFMCTLCEYKCATKSDMTIHIRTHTGEKPFKCTLCKYKCATTSYLTIHMKTHTGEKPVKCTLCSYKCATKSDMTKHMRIHTGEKPFKCALCKYKSATTSHLSMHMNTHTGDKPVKCMLCSYKCATKSDMTKHMRTHTGEKPFKCTLCEYRCTQRSSLTRHIRTHTGEKPSKCSMCDYRCADTSSLARHIITHTAEKSFKRTLCEDKSE